MMRLKSAEHRQKKKRRTKTKTSRKKNVLLIILTTSNRIQRNLEVKISVKKVRKTKI